MMEPTIQKIKDVVHNIQHHPANKTADMADFTIPSTMKAAHLVAVSLIKFNFY